MTFDALPVADRTATLLRDAAEAAAEAAAAFERRPTRDQIPGPVSLFLAVDRPSWPDLGPPRLTTALLRTHDAEGALVGRVPLRTTGRFRRDSARLTRRALCLAAAETGGHVVGYAQPGLAFVLPRLHPDRVQVFGDPARLRPYSHCAPGNNAEIREARQALLAALAADWPAEGAVWQAPSTAGMSGHLRMETYAALPPAVGAALGRYLSLRTTASAPTVVRAGGLLLALLPRKAGLPGQRLVDVARI